VKTARRFQGLSGGSGLGTVNRKIKREKGISKEYSTIQIFYPPRVTSRVKHFFFHSVDPDLPPPFPLVSLARAAIIHCRAPSPLSLPPAAGLLGSGTTYLSVRGLDLEGEALGWLHQTVHPHRRLPEGVQHWSRLCSSASSTSHPPPCCLEGFSL
jgi:hypothetical protein